MRTKNSSAYIQEHGEGGWRTLPQKAGLQRCGKSCRLRWANYLRPDIKRGEFSTEEEQKIIQLHASLGNRWAAIARHLPNRTDNEIKNYWNTHLKKRLAETGIDPVTHKPVGPSSTPTATAISSCSAAHMSPQSELAQPTLRPAASASTQAQLLNRLAAKLAPSKCLQAIKTSQNLVQVLSTEAEKDVVDVSISTPDMPKRPISSTSARLLNTMARRLTTPLHCLNTLKSILSGSSDDQSAGNKVIEPYHDFMHRSASASSLSEAASDMSRSNAISTHDFSPLMESFDLDMLKDWNGEDSHEGKVFEDATYSWNNDPFIENYQLPDLDIF
ncbi:hypothetical protein GH714_041327 [Hevea brasiliensis]|uniref:Uncharacterized protein n=1 Tax=Hevea brasiliensis TaxID=3981 RepID=A0A6A6MWW8_HEVBR|nr:hypothetical protein GH714_041327 [Hevea brasiliensis]